MLSAIWSNPKERILDTHVIFLMNFLNNHGMLSINNRPTWKTLVGGSHSYVNKMMLKLKSKVYLNHKVNKIHLTDDTVCVKFESKNKASELNFDKVILATHSNQAIQLLENPGALIEKTVGQMEYQKNDVVLHCDSNCLPPIKSAHASWNYIIPKEVSDKPIVTYDMNRLQNIVSKKPLLVSLNSSQYIDSKKIIQQFNYEHPIFNKQVLDIQNQFYTVNTKESRLLFCGAYWGNGFHEDGINSGIAVAKLLGGFW
jgi:predicted NAD/FAD-binding protein